MKSKIVFIFLISIFNSLDLFSQFNIPNELEVCPTASNFILTMDFEASQSTILSQVSSASFSTVSLIDDQFSPVINLGFNFNFYGNTYSTCVLSSNNFLSFNVSNANTFCEFTTTSTLGSSTHSDLKNSILAPFQDINPSAGGTIEYATIGTAPNRAFVARWYDVPMYNCSNLTFCSALIIYESSNIIETHLINKPSCSSWQGGLAVHGLINTTGSLTEVIFDDDEFVNRDHGNIWTTSLEGSRFTPSGSSDYTHSYIDFLPIVSLANTTYTDNLGNSYNATLNTTIQNVPGLTHIYASSSICSSFLRDTTVIIPLSTDILIDGALSNSSSICPDQTSTLSVQNSSNFDSFLWNNGSTSSSITVSTPGLYSVESFKDGCSVSSSVTVSLFSDYDVDLGEDTTLCTGQTFLINGATANTNSYSWNTSASTSTIQVTTAGEYILTATSNDGCISSDTINVSFENPPSVNLGDDISFCEGDSVQIGQSISGANYAWNSSQNSSHIYVYSSGTYILEATIGNCSDSDTINITVNTIPEINLSDELSFCEGDSVIIDAFYSATSSYLWHDGSTNSSYTATNSGLIWVTITDNSCSYTDSINITENPYPIVSLGNDTLLCDGDTLTISVQENDATYLWNTTEVTQTINITSSGEYSVEVTNNGCTTYDTIQVTFNEIPIINLGNDIDLCDGDSINLNAYFSTSSTYLWHNGSTNSSYTATSSEFIWVTVTQNQCSFTDSIQITVNNYPELNLGDDIELCVGDEYVLNVTENGASYLWNTGDTTQSITVNTTNTYTVEVTKNGCTAFDTILVEFNEVPTINLGNAIDLCDGDTTLLNAYYNSTSTYLWQDGSTNSTYTSNSTELVWVTVTLENCSYTDSLQITVYPIPDPDLGTDSTLCDGQSIILGENISGAQYLWNTGDTTATITATSSGIYWVTASIGDCENTDSITLTFNETPNINLGNPVNLCEGDSTTFNAFYNSTSTYLWHDGSTNSTYTSNSSELVWVEITLGDCSFTDSVNVTVFTYPITDLGSNIVLCEGDQQQLMVIENNAEYLWNTGDTTQSITVTTTNNYSVQVTKNGCSSFDTIHVLFNDVPTINLGNSVDLCEGDSSVFNAFYNSSATYLWQDGSTNSTYTSNSSEQVIVTISLENCSFSDTVDVTVHPYPITNLGSDIVLCEGDEQLLTIYENNASYLWSNGDTTQNITVTTTNNYSVQVTKNGCSSFDTVHVLFNDVPNINLGNSVVDLCEGDSSVFNAFYNSSATYLWQDGSTNSTYTSNSSEQVIVTVSLDNCDFSDTVNVTVYPYPITELGPDLILCEGDDQLLSITENNASYLWSNGDTTQNITVTTTNNYSVQVTKNGCSSFDTVHVLFNDVPNINLGNSVDLCEGDSSVFNAFYNSSATYLWQDGSTNSTYTSHSTEQVIVTVSLDNCSFSDTVNVTVYPYPITDLGPDISVCENVPVTLFVTENNANYLWNTGDTTQSYIPTTSGEYNVSVTKHGCISYDTILVTLKEIPLISLGNDTTICEGDSVIFDAFHSPSATYIWQDGSTNSTYTGFNTESISVQVTLDGCSSLESIELMVNPIPVITLESVYEICQGDTLSLNAHYSNSASYDWYNSSTQFSSQTTELFTQAGSYSVTVTDNGCSFTKDFKVIVHQKPTQTLEDKAICLGEDYLANAFHSSLISYEWSTGETTSSITVSEEGWYWVDLQNDNCINRDSFYLDVNNIPTYSLPKDTVLCDDTDDELILNASAENAIYLWSTGSTDSAIVIEEIGEYWVNVTNGCGVKRDTIRINPGDCGCSIYAPNAINLNSNGGESGEFKVTSDCEYLEYHLEIYNRWGKRIFESNSFDNPWVPNNGDSHSQDVYIYKLSYGFNSGHIKQSMGSLILLH